MKKNIDKYPNVATLPNDAVTVDVFCKQQDYTTANLYKKVREKKLLDFQIVVFHGINFIIHK